MVVKKTNMNSGDNTGNLYPPSAFPFREPDGNS